MVEKKLMILTSERSQPRIVKRVPSGPARPVGRPAVVTPTDDRGFVEAIEPVEEKIPEEQLVSISPEEALRAGVITQQEFEQATRPEFITITTEEGRIFRRIETEPITAQERAVRIEIPGQEPVVAESGQFLTTIGGPKQVSFLVPESAIPGPPPKPVPIKELERAKEIGRAIARAAVQIPEKVSEVTAGITGRFEIVRKEIGVGVEKAFDLRTGEFFERPATKPEVRIEPVTKREVEFEKFREEIEREKFIVEPARTLGGELIEPTGEVTFEEFARGAATFLVKLPEASLLGITAIVTKPAIATKAALVSATEFPEQVREFPVFTAGTILASIALGKGFGKVVGKFAAPIAERVTGIKPKFAFVTKRLDVLKGKPLTRVSGIVVDAKGRVVSISEAFAGPEQVSKGLVISRIGEEIKVTPTVSEPVTITGIERFKVFLERGVKPLSRVKPLQGGGKLITQRTSPQIGRVFISETEATKALSIISEKAPPVTEKIGRISFFRAKAALPEFRGISFIFEKGRLLPRRQLLLSKIIDTGGTGQDLLVTGGRALRKPTITGLDSLEGGAGFPEQPITLGGFPQLAEKVEAVEVEESVFITIPEDIKAQAISPISRSLITRIEAQQVRQAQRQLEIQIQTQAQQQRQKQRQKIIQSQLRIQAQIQRPTQQQRVIQSQLGTQAQIQTQAQQQRQIQQQITQLRTQQITQLEAPITIPTFFLPPFILPPLLPRKALERAFEDELLGRPRKIGREPSLGGLFIGGFETEPKIEAGLGIRKRVKKPKFEVDLEMVKNKKSVLL